MSQLTVSDNVATSIANIDSIGEYILQTFAERPDKAYIIAKQLGKVAKQVQDRAEEGFKNYWDTNKELPAGYTARVTTRRTYDYGADAEWLKMSEAMKAREAVLQQATEMSLKGATYLTPEGEVVQGVPVKYSETYSLISPTK